MATENWVNIGSGNDLLPDGTKSLPEPMLLFISKDLWHSCEDNFTRQPSITKISLKITSLTFLSNLLGANELKLPQGLSNGFGGDIFEL